MKSTKPTINTLDPARLPPMLTVKQYTEITQTKEPAVRAQLRAGTLIGYKVGPRLWRIPRDVVRQWLEGGSINADKS